MKVREFFLLLLIITVGVLFYHIHTGKLNFDFDWEDGFFFTYEEFVYEETQDLELPFPGELQVLNSHGEVYITGTDDNKITVTFTKRIRRRNEEQADDVARDLQMLIDRDEQKITLTTNRSEFRKKNFRTDFNIYLPAGADINVKNSYGLIKAKDIGKGFITNPHGKTRVYRASGDVIISNSYKDVEVSDLQAKCEIESRHAEVSAFNISGDTIISNRYGRIHLENCSRDVIMNGSHTKIYGERISGTSEIENSYAEVSLNQVGPIIILGNHSPIKIETLQGDLEIKNRYGKITLDDIDGSIDIDGKNLAVNGKTIQGESIYISTSYRDIDLKDFTGKTMIILSHGKLQLAPDPLTHTIEVRGSHSGIDFFWPEGEQYPLEAQTKGGDIEWSLADEPSVRVENGSSIIKAYMDRTDKPAIKLATSYGTIWIGKQ